MADETVQVGDVKTFDAKKPWESTAVWGLFILLVTWAVKKWVPSLLHNDAIKVALEIISYLVGSAMVLYGRWKATRPLSLTSDIVTKQVS